VLFLKVIQGLRSIGLNRSDFLIKDNVLASKIRFADITIKLILYDLIHYFITVHPRGKTCFSWNVLLEDRGLSGLERIYFNNLL